MMLERVYWLYSQRRVRSEVTSVSDRVQSERDCGLLTWFVHAQLDALLVATELTVRSRLFRYLARLVLGTRERHVGAALQAAKVELLQKQNKNTR